MERKRIVECVFFFLDLRDTRPSRLPLVLHLLEMVRSLYQSTIRANEDTCQAQACARFMNLIGYCSDRTSPEPNPFLSHLHIFSYPTKPECSFFPNPHT